MRLSASRTALTRAPSSRSSLPASLRARFRVSSMVTPACTCRFTRGSAFLLLAENVNTYQIDEAERIDKAILHLYDHEKWLEHWIVVSEVSQERQ